MKTFRFQVYLKPKNQEEYEACEYLLNKKRQKSELLLRLLVEFLQGKKELNEKVDNIERVVNNIQKLIENNNLYINDIEKIQNIKLEDLNSIINTEEEIHDAISSDEDEFIEKEEENKTIEEKPIEDKEKQDVIEGLDMFLSSI